MELTRQQQRFNNPNVTNRFGSTITTFGADDQADITQTMSDEMNGLIDQQMAFVGKGPSQYKGGNNQGLQQMFNAFAGRTGASMPYELGQSIGSLLIKPQDEMGPTPPSENLEVPPMIARPGIPMARGGFHGGGGNYGAGGQAMPFNPMDGNMLRQFNQTFGRG